MQKRVNLVDLVKSFQTSIHYLLAKFGFDTAENEPLKVRQKIANVESQKKRQNKHRFKGFQCKPRTAAIEAGFCAQQGDPSSWVVQTAAEVTYFVCASY